MSLGLERGTVRVVPHDPEWATLFATESQRLRAVFGPELPIAIEHAGSTAVPGLAAKPILDVVGGYPPGARLERYIASLVQAGYVHRGERGIPGRQFFRRGDPRSYHLHLVVQGGPLWREYLAFRDALRAQPAVRDAYAALKLELARRHVGDREAYTEGKTTFVRQVLAEALGPGHVERGAAAHRAQPSALAQDPSRESPGASGSCAPRSPCVTGEPAWCRPLPRYGMIGPTIRPIARLAPTIASAHFRSCIPPTTDHLPPNMKARERDELLRLLKERFDAHTDRHQGMAWPDVLARVESSPAALKSLQAMEQTGGEPDVTGRDDATGGITFTDCAAESPAGRRSLCYDGAALAARKANKPAGSAVEVAASMGIALVTEEQYRALQQLGEFDRKTSSWVATPSDVRSLGGALFCDRRYGRVFLYHNGAESYYAARGFRGTLTV